MPEPMELVKARNEWYVLPDGPERVAAWSRFRELDQQAKTRARRGRESLDRGIADMAAVGYDEAAILARVGRQLRLLRGNDGYR